MTKALTATCRGDLHIHLLEQSCQRPLPSESRHLQLPHASRAVVRQVAIECNRIPRVYARTVLPRESLAGPPRKLLHLGERPLGAVLFADPSMRREATEVAYLTPDTRLFRIAEHTLSITVDGLWARRSIYRLRNLPLLVTEVFLPALAHTSPRRHV